MEVDTGATFSKHKRSRDKGDREHKKKRHRSDKDTSKHKSKTEHKTRIVDDDVDDEDMWMEKNIDMDGEKVRGRTPIVEHWLMHPIAYCYKHTFCRQLEDYVQSYDTARGPSTSTVCGRRDSLEARRVDA